MPIVSPTSNVLNAFRQSEELNPQTSTRPISLAKCAQRLSAIRGIKPLLYEIKINLVFRAQRLSAIRGIKLLQRLKVEPLKQVLNAFRQSEELNIENVLWPLPHSSCAQRLSAIRGIKLEDVVVLHDLPVVLNAFRQSEELNLVIAGGQNWLYMCSTPFGNQRN